MCYPKPGPRCSSHARQTLNTTEKKYLSALQSHKDAKEVKDLKSKYLQAQKDWLMTPEGIATLEENGDAREAEIYRESRKKAIAQHKAQLINKQLSKQFDTDTYDVIAKRDGSFAVVTKDVEKTSVEDVEKVIKKSSLKNIHVHEMTVANAPNDIDGWWDEYDPLRHENIETRLIAGVNIHGEYADEEYNRGPVTTFTGRRITSSEQHQAQTQRTPQRRSAPVDTTRTDFSRGTPPPGIPYSPATGGHSNPYAEARGLRRVFGRRG